MIINRVFNYQVFASEILRQQHFIGPPRSTLEQKAKHVDQLYENYGHLMSLQEILDSNISVGVSDYIDSVKEECTECLVHFNFLVNSYLSTSFDDNNSYFGLI